MKYPKIKAVEALPGKVLRVTFANGSVRFYDCSRLIDTPAFQALKNDAFFRNVHTDDHGYGVIWNEDVDLAESELWIHGKTEPPAAADN